MKILVCGSRGYTNQRQVYAVLDTMRAEYPDITIISGMARGPDRYAALYAAMNNIPLETYLPDWDTYGNRAGIIRNTQMLSVGKPDQVIAFWDGVSRGTKHMMDIARRKNITVTTIGVL